MQARAVRANSGGLLLRACIPRHSGPFRGLGSWSGPVRSGPFREIGRPNILTVWPLSGSVLSRCFTAPLGVLLAIRTLEDGWYVVINAYKLTVFEIWRDLNVLSYIACPRYPYIRVYRLYDRKLCSLN